LSALIAKFWAWVVALVLVFGMGLGAGYKLFRSKPTPPEKPAAAIVQSDGSLVVARTVDAAAKPPMEVPSGYRVLHQGSVVVAPKTVATPADPKPGTAAPLPTIQSPTTLNWVLVQGKDGDDRFVVKSPDGTVVSATDVAVGSERPAPKELKWAAGGIYGLNTNGGKSVGAFVDHDWKFLRTGVEVTKETYTTAKTEWAIRGKFGIRW